MSYNAHAELLQVITPNAAREKAGVGGGLGRMDGWIPCPSVLGQMDPLSPSVLRWMDGHGAFRQNTASNALDRNALNRITLSVTR